MTVFVDPTHIHDKDAYWIDVRFNLADAAYGKRQYDTQHMNGASFWDIEKDLSDMDAEAGRHPMPSKAQLEALFHQTGLTYDKPIYLYDEGGQPFTSRAYFMLQYGGFEHVYIVQGGLNALIDAGFETTDTQQQVARSTMPIRWNEDVYVDRAHVKEVVKGLRQKVLLDARAAKRYRGEIEPIDQRAGHIPGARNFDWEQLVAGDRLKIDSMIEQVVSKDESIITYCGSGVTASPLFAALKHLGYENVQLYTGSYSDWEKHEPIETSL